jgi:hypothetical protein
VSINTGHTTVTSTATYVTTGKTGASWVQLHAPQNGNTMYIGGSDVTTSTGLELTKGVVVQIWLAETDKLYAIIASGTETLKWMHTGGR